MSTLFPVAIDDVTTLPPPGPNTVTNAGAVTHAILHDNEILALQALETKLGIGSSTSTTSTVLRSSSNGTSVWGKLVLTSDVTGTLPVANGGTGVTSSTGTGSLVLSNSPALVTPTGIVKGDVGLGNVDNTSDATKNAASATLTNKTITTGGGNVVSTAVLSNPYKFSVYRTAAYTSISAAATVYPFDTKLFDTGTNIDVSTNKGRFTAPVAGFWQFNGMINLASSATRVVVIFNKNGAELTRGNDGAGFGAEASPLIQLAANDFIEMTYFTASAIATSVTTTGCHFSGYLVSIT